MSLPYLPLLQPALLVWQSGMKTLMLPKAELVMRPLLTVNENLSMHGLDQRVRAVAQHAARGQRRDPVRQRSGDAGRGQGQHRDLVATDIAAGSGAHFETARRVLCAGTGPAA
jgi:hypothetical protein